MSDLPGVPKPSKVNLNREMAVFRYVAALDEGDLATIAEILDSAATDDELDRQLTGVDSALHVEVGLDDFDERARAVRELVLRHIPSAIQDEGAAELTVGEVAARIQRESSLALAPPDRLANVQLLDSRLQVSPPVTPAVVARIRGEVSVIASERYWERFRQTAVMIAISRQRGEVELAAARRQGAASTVQRRPRRRPGGGTL